MTYTAVGMNAELPNGRKSGILEVGDFSMKFIHSDNQSVTFLLDENLVISLGGSNNNIIFFTHKNAPGWSLYTEDSKLLKEPSIARLEMAKQVLKKRTGNRVLLYSVVFGLLGFIALLVLAFALFRGAMVRSIANQVPTSFDAEAGERLYPLVTQNRTVIEDTALIAELNTRVAPLLNVVEDTSIKFKFYIIQDPTLNAFALPGGHVVIHSGLLEKASGWNEVLGVLAHEISHVTRRHHVRGVVSQLGAFYILSLFIGDGGAIGTIILQTGSQLESLMYSREFETEADESGWDYLIRSGIHPEGMISFFEKLEKEYGIKHDENDARMNFLSTHPATDERIKTLRKKEKDITNGEALQKNVGDYESFRKQLLEKIK